MLPLYKRQENPTTIVEELAKLHRPQADAKSITFEVNAASDLPELLVDRHRLLQLLSNLLSNAFKFTPENGHVALRAFLDSEVVVFEVSDDGIGISREQQARLFDRFWQGAHTRDAGVGLGLSGSTGFGTKPITPKPATRSGIFGSPDITSTGMSQTGGVRSCARRNARPSIFGMKRSSSTTP